MVRNPAASNRPCTVADAVKAGFRRVMGSPDNLPCCPWCADDDSIDPRAVAAYAHLDDLEVTVCGRCAQEYAEWQREERNSLECQAMIEAYGPPDELW